MGKSAHAEVSRQFDRICAQAIRGLDAQFSLDRWLAVSFEGDRSRLNWQEPCQQIDSIRSVGDDPLLEFFCQSMTQGEAVWVPQCPDLRKTLDENHKSCLATAAIQSYLLLTFGETEKSCGFVLGLGQHPRSGSEVTEPWALQMFQESLACSHQMLCLAIESVDRCACRKARESRENCRLRSGAGISVGAVGTQVQLQIPHRD